MEMKKKIPYGIPNFESIRTENYAYVDKTRFIEMIENEPTKYQFLIRPRKFGKSLFLSMLRRYYDVCYADLFDTLFGDLYIGKHPTPKRNALFVIRFSFSGLDTSSTEKFQRSFTTAIRSSIEFFITDHRSIIADYKILKEKIWNIDNVRGFIEFAFDIINGYNRKAYIIIDEYDHFANDLIAMGTNLSKKQYKELIWANGVVRDFYETLKDNTDTVIDKIFITGITPIMLDDITSGFNISNNLSNDLRFSEILGFTEEDIEWLLDEAGIDRAKIAVDRKFLYNGYIFHPNAEQKLYNPSMILFLAYKVSITDGKLDEIIDDNLKIDYGRIQMLLDKPENIKKLEEIIEHGQVASIVTARFSIDKIHETKNFLSLLYYMGLVTIDKGTLGERLLKIPNYTSKTMYWEYMENMIMERNSEMIYDPSVIYQGLITLSFKGDYKPFFENFHQNFVSQISKLQPINENYIIKRSIEYVLGFLQELYSFVTDDSAKNLPNLLSQQYQFIEELIRNSELRRIIGFNTKQKISVTDREQFDYIFRYKEYDRLKRILQTVYLLEAFQVAATVAAELGLVLSGFSRFL